MTEFEHTITDDIIVAMLNRSNPVSEPDQEPTSYDQPTQKSMPYHHPHHKNCGLVLTTRIDCGWIDGWSWNNLTKCLRTLYHCVSSILQSCNTSFTY
jgi:hypothetical protein